MYRGTYNNLCASAAAKEKLYHSSPLGYIFASLMAGIFVTFGGMVAMTVGGYLQPLMGAASKLPAALAFSSALSLAIFAGCELFTGNNLVFAGASFEKKMPWLTTLKLWGIGWFGNVFGVWGTILVYHLAGADTVAGPAEYFAAIAEAKIALSPLAMVCRGILCNMCVCLAIWCSFRMTSDSGKLIMTIWCVFIFMVCGFEHSVANMGIIGVALVNPCGHDITMLGYLNNLFWVTLGNILGAVAFIAFPYHVMLRQERHETVEPPKPSM